MDTNELQQINSFVKGMNTDIADAYLNNDQYRFAKNLRLTVEEDSNAGELHTINGVSEITIPGEISKLWTNILGTASIRDYGILITRLDKESKEEVDTWSIYRFNLNDDKIKFDKVFGPCKEPLWDKNSNDYKLSLVTRWESDENVKLYIADGVHSLMIVNIMEDNGSSFTNISTKENIMLTQPVVEEVLLSQGDLNYAVVQYAYRLYNRYGITTNISPLSKPELIYKQTESGLITGIQENESSSVAVKFKINIPKSDFKFIKVYRIGYVQKGLSPEICVILDENIENLKEILFIDNGTIELELISSDEFTVDTGIYMIPKTIESKNDYLFAANVNYIQDELFDKWDAASNIECIAVRDDNGILLDREVAHSNDNNPNKLFTSNDYIKYDKHCQKPSLRRGEWYRYGIVLYDKHGNRSQVKWIGDVRYENYDMISHKTGGLFYGLTDNSYEIKAHPVGMKFKIIGSLPDECVGYEIVRCERTVLDSYTITQGVLSCTIKHTDEESELYNQYSASPVISTDRFYHGFLGAKYNLENKLEIYTVAENSSYDLLSFISPEISYQGDDIENLLNSGQQYYINPLMSYCSITTDSHENNKYQFVVFNVDTVTGGSVVNNYRSETVLGNLKYSVLNVGDVAGYNKILGASLYAPLIGMGNTDILFSSDNAFGLQNEIPYRVYTPIYNTSYIPNDSNNQNDFDKYYNYAAYIKLRPYISQINDLMLIERAKIPELYEWNDLFSNNESHTVNIRSKQITLGDYTYDNCSVGTIMNQLGSEYGSIRPIDKMNTPNFENYTIGDTTYDVKLFRGAFAQLIGPSGRQMIIKPNLISYSFKSQFNELYYSEKIVPPFRCMLCNIQKRTNAKYGGDSELQKKSNIYYSSGNFYNKDVTEGVVYDGDTYIQLYEHVHMYRWFDSKNTHGSKLTIIYAIPLESSINLAVAHGARYSNLRLNNQSVNYGWILNKASSISAKVKVTNDYYNIEEKDVTMNYTQDHPMYQYNTAYSTIFTALLYASQQTSDIKLNKFDNRVCYSDPKLNNEDIDSWQTFLPANFIDVDSRFGEITGLRLFKDKLIYWQEHATGILSVNERSLITDASNSELVLGTGDVLSRYDYLSTTYGMHKNQYCDAQSEHNLYWWDENKRALCNYTQGGSVTPLNVVKLVKKYTNTIDCSNNPMLLFDNNHHELLAHISNDVESLVYNEQIQGFTSIYNLDPDNYIQFRNGIVLVKDEKLYHYNQSSDKKTYGFGNKVLAPYVEFVINKHVTLPKVYDNQIINGSFNKTDLNITYTTQLGQEGKIKNGVGISDRQLDYRLAIPRNGESSYGDRLRGKIMNVALESISNSTQFAIGSVLTKYRLSL